MEAALGHGRLASNAPGEGGTLDGGINCEGMVLASKMNCYRLVIELNCYRTREESISV